jgi:hypothetical protein
MKITRPFIKTLKDLDEIQAHLEKRRMSSSIPKLRRVRAQFIKLKLELDADKTHIDHDRDVHHHD